MDKKSALLSKKKFLKMRLYLILPLAILIFCFGCGVYLLLGGGNEPVSVSQENDDTDAAHSDTELHPAPSQVSAAPASESPWNLILVNPWNPLPENHSLTLAWLNSDQAVDERCFPDLQEMLDDCRAAGLSPLVCSSYRTQEKQEALYSDQVNKLIAQGYSESEAAAQAATMIAVPGTSEHQSGLAVDIVDTSYQILDESQADTQVQKWLMEHCWEYGFILRYPDDKCEITGIIYEPWHYRYVGREAAKEITEAGICLEEYLELQQPLQDSVETLVDE